jgi:thiol-disulfide isomerase/thioredoxin
VAGLILAACAATSKEAPATKPPRPVILGVMEPAAILALGEAWAGGESTYEPLAAPVEFLASSDAPVEVEVLFGTWCGDSQEQVPHYLKILERAEAARAIHGGGPLPIHTRFVGVDREKKQPADLVAGKGIERVPTFLVYSEGREVGRVTETPVGRLEEDLAALVAEAGPAAR